MPGRECGGQVARYDGQRYVAVAETRKIANTRELAIQVDGPQKGRTGDLVVVDVIDPHTACAGVSQGSYRFCGDSTILGKSVRSRADKDIQVPAPRLWGAAGDGIVEREDRFSSTTEPPSRTWFARRGEVLQ